MVPLTNSQPANGMVISDGIGMLALSIAITRNTPIQLIWAVKKVINCASSAAGIRLFLILVAGSDCAYRSNVAILLDALRKGNDRIGRTSPPQSPSPLCREEEGAILKKG